MRHNIDRPAYTIYDEVRKGRVVTIDDLAVFKQELLLDIVRIVGLNKDTPTKKWLKTSEVRELLGLSNGTMMTLRTNGTLPYTRVGNVIYYDRSDIEEMLKNKKRNKTGDNKQSTDHSNV